MIGDRPRVVVGERGEREERLALLLELRRVRSGLRSPVRSAWTYYRIRRALLERAATAGVRLFVEMRAR